MGAEMCLRKQLDRLIGREAETVLVGQFFLDAVVDLIDRILFLETSKFLRLRKHRSFRIGGEGRALRKPSMKDACLHCRLLQPGDAIPKGPSATANLP
jgi:hypothetical protein